MKKVNKFTLLLIVCLISVALVLVLVACDDQNTDNHNHEWSAWSIATEPTQDVPGSVTRTCSVDGCTVSEGVQTVEIPALSSDSYTAGADTATCSEAGTKTYTVTIPNYDAFTFSVYSPAKGNHSISAVGAKAATCIAQGAEAYWECETCHKKFSDENGANEISAPVATEINPNNHTIVNHERVKAKCNADGCEAYWECTDCHKLYKEPVYTSDKEIDEPVVIDMTPDKHNLTPHQTNSATCKADGNIAYWACDDCGKYFSDAEGTEEITEDDTIISKSTVKHTLTYNSETAGCTWDGHKEYWECSVCEKLFSDEAGTTEIEEPEFMAAHHTLTSVAASKTSKTVTNSANASIKYNSIAHYQCSVCNKTFRTADGKEEITTLYYTSSCRLGMLLDFGVNKAYPQGGSASYYADSKGKYTFIFESAITGLGYFDTTETTVATANMQTIWNGSAWTDTAKSYSKFVVADCTSTKVVINMEKGDIVQFRLPSSVTNVTVEKDPVLYYGDNTVFIKSDSIMDANVYTFMPTEAKYSMTIPEGLYVEMDGKELADAGNGELTVNFECTANQEITFSFYGSAIGTYQVAIGEFVKPITLELGESTTVTVNHSGEVIQQKTKPMTTVLIGDSVTEGKYKLTITVRMMQSNMCFGVNYDGTADEFVGANWTDGQADVWFSAYNSSRPNSEKEMTVTASPQKIEITLDLKAGDVLTFLSNDTTNRSTGLTLSLEAVA